MILKSVVFFALLSSTIQASNVNQPTHAFFVSLDDGNLAKVTNAQIGNCTPETFFESGELCIKPEVEKAVINGIQKQAQPIIEDRAKLLLHYFSELHTSEYVHSYASKKGLERLGKEINQNNIASFAYDSVLPYLARYINYNTLQGLATFANFIKLIPRRDLIATIDGMVGFNGSPRTWVGENGAKILERVSPDKIWITDFSVNTVRTILGSVESCAKLTHIMVRNLLQKEAYAKILTKECAGQIPNPSSYECTEEIRNLPTPILNKDFPFTHKSCFKYMTSSQIAELDKDPDSDKPCASYYMEFLPFNGQEITPQCFAGALRSKQPGSVEITSWDQLPANILSEIEHSDLANFNNNIWQSVPATYKQVLFEKPDDCKNLPDNILAYHGHVKIGTECFNNLSNVNKVDALINADLENDALANLDSRSVQDWTYDGGNLTKLAVLNAAMSRPNIGALIANMGTKSEDHPCSAVADLEELKKAVALQIFGSDQCFNQMEKAFSNVGLLTLKELESRARAKVNKDKLLENLDEQKFRDLDPDTFSSLQRDTKICSIMSANQFAGLREEALKVLTSKCFAEMKCLSELRPGSLSYVPDDVLAESDVSVISQLPSGLMNAHQFGLAGSKVTDLARHPATAWDERTLQNYSRPSIAVIHKSAWKAAPPRAYSALNSTNFSAIPPQDMEDMRAEQLSEVPEEARKTLTNDQAKSIGKNSGDNILPLFENLVSPGAKSILAARAGVQPKKEANPEPKPEAKEEGK